MKGLVFGGSGEDGKKLTKENRDSVMVQPFSSFNGHLAMCQVMFTGAGKVSTVHCSNLPLFKGEMDMVIIERRWPKLPEEGRSKKS